MTRQVWLYVGVTVLLLAVSLAAVGMRGLPLALTAALGGAVAFAAGLDTIQARRIAARHALAVRAVAEAVASGASVVEASALVVALDDSWLSDVYENVREEQEALWRGRIERGECSER